MARAGELVHTGRGQTDPVLAVLHLAGDPDDHAAPPGLDHRPPTDRKSTRLNSSHVAISYAVFCLKKKKRTYNKTRLERQRWRERRRKGAMLAHDERLPE